MITERRVQLDRERLSVGKCAATDDTRPILGCIEIASDGSVSATDAYMLIAVGPKRDSEPDGGEPILLPAALARKAMAERSATPPIIVQSNGTTSIETTSAGARVVRSTETITGASPNWRRMVARQLSKPVVARVYFDQGLLGKLCGVLSHLCVQGVWLEIRSAETGQGPPPIILRGKTDGGEQEDVMALLMPMQESWGTDGLTGWCATLVKAEAPVLAGQAAACQSAGGYEPADPAHCPE